MVIMLCDDFKMDHGYGAQVLGEGPLGGRVRNFDLEISVRKINNRNFKIIL